MHKGSSVAMVPERILRRLARAGNNKIEHLTQLSADLYGRATFQARLLNTRSLKLRRASSKTSLCNSRHALHRLASRHFPKTLFYDGLWSCTEWVEGSLLKDIRSQDERVKNSTYFKSIAELQACIHQETTSQQIAFAMRKKYSTSLMRVFNHRAVLLRNASILSHGDYEKLFKLILKTDLDRSSRSITHGDLSDKNILFVGGVPVSIDNEALQPHYSDYDLWKAIFYLKLDANMADQYVADYRNIYDRDSIDEHKAFWLLYSLVEDIYLRKYINFIDYIPQAKRLRQTLIFSEI